MYFDTAEGFKPNFSEMSLVERGFFSSSNIIWLMANFSRIISSKSLFTSVLSKNSLYAVSDFTGTLNRSLSSSLMKGINFLTASKVEFEHRVV